LRRQAAYSRCMSKTKIAMGVALVAGMLAALLIV
jgi:hypothetical protein